MKTFFTGFILVLLLTLIRDSNGQPLLRTYPSGNNLNSSEASNSDPERFSRVKIWLDDKSAMDLAKLGIDLTEGEYRKGVWFISDFSDREINKVRLAGFRTEMLIEDVKTFYKSRIESAQRNIHPPQIQTGTCGVSAPFYPVPLQFYHGSMGGFFTYNQFLDILDSMALLYPNLITLKQPVDTVQSIEGRDILYVKISDNPNMDEPEPEVLYTALHHAREPESLSQLIFYMWYLLENYGTDSGLQALVDNTEMYFIPCINPDGYVYNESTDPSGGGMWRKNRRDNLDGEFGVDLNRNYEHNWGIDDNGSSPFTSESTYRGTGPFSEPEIQAVSNFCNRHDFRIALNYHTYGDHIIIPWGYIPLTLTPDSLQFDFYGHAIARYNQYHVGTASQTVGYVVNGSSDDWMYGEQVSKPKILAMTPEVGNPYDGFWPDPGRIDFLSQSNVYANLTMARLAGKYGILTPRVPRYTSQFSNEFHFSFRQLGLDTTGTYTIFIAAVTTNVIAVGSQVTLSNLSPLQSVDDSISFTLDPLIAPGDLVRYIIAVDNGFYTETDTITQVYGLPVIVLNDDGSDLTHWDSNTDWDNTTEDFVSGPSSITDSPFNVYQSGNSSSLVLNSPFSLAGAIEAHLTFHAKWSLEAGFDYTQLTASTDGGITWEPLCGKYTVEGGPYQAEGEPLYHAYQNEWVEEEISLNNYLGMNILLRFNITSDGFSEYDGFYFDDLKVEMITASGVGMSQVPNQNLFLSHPAPNPATDDAVVSFNNLKPKSEFQLYNTFGQLIWKKSIDNSSGKIIIPVKDLNSGIYLYKVRLADGSDSKAHKLIVD